MKIFGNILLLSLMVMLGQDIVLFVLFVVFSFFELSLKEIIGFFPTALAYQVWLFGIPYLLFVSLFMLFEQKLSSIRNKYLLAGAVSLIAYFAFRLPDIVTGDFYKNFLWYYFILIFPTAFLLVHGSRIVRKWLQIPQNT